MNVEDYMLDGICEGCDIDPIKCHSENSCYYESKKSEYNFVPGDEVFYVTKAENKGNIIQIIIVKRIIKSLKDTTPEGEHIYWLIDMCNNAAGAAPEYELFKNQYQALDYATCACKIFN